MKEHGADVCFSKPLASSPAKRGGSQALGRNRMKLKESLDKKKFVVTSEIQAPIDEEPEALIKRLELIRGRVDGVAVPELEVEGVVGDSIKACDLLKQNRFESIYQTTTRDKNRPQLQKDLLLAHEAGVENLLVFTEDYRITGDSLQEMMFFSCGCGKALICLRAHAGRLYG